MTARTPNRATGAPENANPTVRDQTQQDQGERSESPAIPSLTNKKRPRSQPDNTSSPACNQCRTRKIRCDRQQPKCSNCRRADVECDFATTPKRVDRTKQLLNDFSGVVARLDRVDNSLAKLSEQLQQQQPCRCSHSPVPSQVDNPWGASEPAAIYTTYTPKSSTSCRSPHLMEVDGSEDCDPEIPNGDLVDFDQGGQRLLDYPAALSLFKNLQRQITRWLTKDVPQGSELWQVIAQQPGFKASLEYQLEQFPFGGLCHEPVIVSDHRPISTPPRYLLELSLDGFLRHINIHTPIFDDSSLGKAIDTHYQSLSAGTGDAWALTFTNIIILTVALDARVARATASHLVSMNDDMLPSFLKNCDRALADLNRFTAPCLINVQVLLTLALVAREFYGSVVFEKVCQAVCQVARSTGLHRAHGARSMRWEKMPERERLFWVVYTMDKQRAFLTGQPCDLYLFDSDIQLRSCGERAPFPLRLNAAYVHMMTIWEQIFINLYSSRAVFAGAADRSRQVQQLWGSLNEWNIKYHALLSSPILEKMADLAPMQLELKYCFMVSQVLVHRCDRNARSQQRYRDPARSALKLIAQVAGDHRSITLARCAVLARMFRNYPLVAVHDLFSFCLTVGEPDSTEDGQLIHETRRHLELLHYADFPQAYFARLEVGLKWCTDMLDTIKDCLSRSAVAGDWGAMDGSSTGLSDRTPPSESELSSIPPDAWASLNLPMSRDEMLCGLSPSVPSEGLLDPQFSAFGLTTSSTGDSTVPAFAQGGDNPAVTMHPSMWVPAEVPCNSSEPLFDPEFTRSIMS
ncbi:C6 transcription factor [Aspergillus flavus AF70]|nr:C6 transcription factor [Aspergillus flavus AF70]